MLRTSLLCSRALHCRSHQIIGNPACAAVGIFNIVVGQINHSIQCHRCGANHNNFTATSSTYPPRVLTNKRRGNKPRRKQSTTICVDGEMPWMLTNVYTSHNSPGLPVNLNQFTSTFQRYVYKSVAFNNTVRLRTVRKFNFIHNTKARHRYNRHSCCAFISNPHF